MGGDWELLLLYADFPLIPLNSTTSCLPWCSGYPSLESLVHPVQRINLQTSAGAVTGHLPGAGNQYCLFTAFLMFTPSEETCIFNS